MGLWAALALVALPVPGALAQQQAQQPTQTGQARTSGIEAITVTAQRREQLLQETPVAVTAFSTEDLESLSINSTERIAAFTPGLVISKASNSNGMMSLFGRGVGNADNSPLVDNKVGLYVDGAYSPSGLSSMFDLMDIERIEVLRGPQGTLYGRNTIGGAINIISRKPTNEFGFKVKGILGHDNKQALRGTVNFPIVPEKVMARLSFTRNTRDGYYRNLLPGRGDKFDDEDVKGFRSALRLLPTEDLSLDYTFEWIEMDQRNPIFPLRSDCGSGCLTNVVPPATQFMVCAFCPFIGFPQFFNPNANFAAFATNDNDDVYIDGEQFARNKSWNHAVNIEWNLSENVTLKSVSGWRRFVFGGANDLDGSPFNMFHSGQHEFARNFFQELILNGNAGDGRLEYTVGVNWYEQESRLRNYSDQFVDCPVCTGFFPTSQSARTTADNYAKAGFGQATLNVTDRLSLTGGIRYTNERRSIQYQFCGNDATRSRTNLAGRDYDTCVSFYNGVTNVPFLVDRPQDAIDPRSVFANQSARFDGWSPMARAQFEWTDSHLTYLTWARGYQSGGFNPRPGGASQALLILTSTPFDEESLFSWEAGYKSRWFDDRLQLNVAGYYNEFKDQQITTFVPGGGTVTAVQNAGRSRIRGVEFEALAAPFAGLTVMLSHAWTNFDYAEYIGADPTDPTGQRQVDFVGTRDRAHLPKRKWSGFVEYAFPEMGFGQLTVGANFLRESPKNWLETKAQDFHTKSSSYTIYGARVQLDQAFGVEGLSLAVNGENITDRTYFCCQGIDFFFFAANSYGKPRQISFEVAYEYGGI
jgi:iron complex outermembrane receptor protein